MLSVVILARDASPRLVPALSALVPGVANGLVKDAVIVAGGAASDEVAALADAAGCAFHAAQGSDAACFAAGAAIVRGRWLLLLAAETVLERGWDEEAARFLEQAELAGDRRRVATFRYAVDDFSRPARVLEAAVALRLKLFATPEADQGLIVSRALLESDGGVRAPGSRPLAHLVRHAGRARLVVLTSRAIVAPRPAAGPSRRIVGETGRTALAVLRPAR